MQVVGIARVARGATAFHHNARLLEGRRGVDDFLPKPIDIDELESRLSAAERLVRAVRTLQRVKDRLHATVARAQIEQAQRT